jgi:hypothetical protein
VKRLALAVLVLVTLLRLALASHLGLSADEAYYWTWGLEPTWDHPPGVALLIDLGCLVFGDTELGVRSGGLLLQGLAMGLLLGHERWSAGLLLLLGAPAVLLVGMVAVPDVGLLSLWTLAVVASERGRPVLAGLLAGLALWFKLPAVLLVGALLLARRDRSGLISAGTASLVGAPALALQLVAGGLGFQAEHGLGRGDGGLGPLLELLGAQVGLLGPLLVLGAFVWLWRGRRDAWWWSAALTLALFLPASLLSRPEGNWLLPFSLAALVGLSRSTGRLGRVAEWGGAFALVMSLMVLVHALHPLRSLPRDPLDQLRSGPVIAESVQAWGVEPVLCERYQEAAWIAFYGGLETTTVPDRGRRDQYDLRPRQLPERTVFVRPASQRERVDTEDLYPERSGPHRVVAQDGDRILAEWQVFEVWGYDSPPEGVP